MPKGIAINYTAEQEAFLLNNCKLTRKELTQAFNSMFAMSVSQQNIEAKCKRMGAMTGRTGRFEKGCTTWNANTRGLTGRNKTSFKKGSTPHNKKPMYSERICAKDGYILIKVQETSPQYMLKHRWLWMQEHGEIPKDKVLVFKNGNKLDVRLDNLMLVSRAELAVKNHEYAKLSNQDTNETCFLLAKVKLQTNNQFHTSR